MAAGRAPRVASWEWEVGAGFQCAASPRAVSGAAQRLLRCTDACAASARGPARRCMKYTAANCLSQNRSYGDPHGVHYACTRHLRAGAAGGVPATPPAARLRTAPTAKIGDWVLALPSPFSFSQR